MVQEAFEGAQTLASVAEIIHQREDAIMKRWLELARASASARGLNTAALENIMPLYLSALADQVETGQVDANDRRHKRVQAHLSTRLRQGFDLAEVLEEFRLLGRCIAEEWRHLPDEQRPTGADIERLDEHIHLALKDVTDTFHRHMLKDEQSEKRYLRLLQGIASEALLDQERPLRDRLREILEVVVSAMDAQCAAFLFYDLNKRDFVLVASAGDPAIEPYATSQRARAFVAEVAANEEPTAITDSSSESLEVPEELQKSGIQSLLGIRLPPRNTLLGVMYIGVPEKREFTSRELRRLESLGERLALHLENARLFGELRDRLEALDTEKALRERFVSLLAHDLRGPLSAARLGAELLAMEPASLDQRRDLAVKIERNIERVDRMIRDLLDANRIRAGETLPLRLDSCDLASVIEQIADEARALHGDRFIVDVARPLLGTWSEEELHRAVWNLVTNAVKYGAKDRPITISGRRHGDGVRVSVHNEGTPIPATEQAHIFDPYARASTAAQGGTAGWGLGLTLVRGVARAHGGDVSMTSEEGAGTTFTIELPVDARRPASSEKHPPPPGR